MVPGKLWALSYPSLYTQKSEFSASAGCGQMLRAVGEGIVCVALAQLWKQQLHFWSLIQGEKRHSTATSVFAALPVLKEKKKTNLVK